MISMNKLQTNLRRLSYKLKHDFLTVENVVLVLAIVLCLVLTYQSIAAMSRNWELTERLASEKKNLELLSIEVEAAELENEYYQSNEYQELLARKYLDKKMPGENMVIMPENSDAAKNKYQVTTVDKKKDKEYSNFEKWMMYLFPNY